MEKLKRPLILKFVLSSLIFSASISIFLSLALMFALGKNESLFSNPLFLLLSLFNVITSVVLFVGLIKWKSWALFGVSLYWVALPLLLSFFPTQNFFPSFPSEIVNSPKQNLSSLVYQMIIPLILLFRLWRYRPLFKKRQ